MRLVDLRLVLLIALLVPRDIAAGSERPLNAMTHDAPTGERGLAAKPPCCRDTAKWTPPSTQSRDELPWLHILFGLVFFVGAGLVFWLARTDTLPLPERLVDDSLQPLGIGFDTKNQKEIAL